MKIAILLLLPVCYSFPHCLELQVCCIFVCVGTIMIMNGINLVSEYVSVRAAAFVAGVLYTSSIASCPATQQSTSVCVLCICNK